MDKYKPSCKKEEEFLRAYDPSQFSPIAVTVDAVIFGIEKDNTDNYRKLDEQSIKVYKENSELYNRLVCIFAEP